MSFSTVLLVCGGIATLAAAVEIIRRYSRKPIAAVRGWFTEQSRAAKTLNGYEPIVDPTNGKVLQEAVPGVAKRVTTLEDLVTQLAQSHITLVGLQERILSLEEWRTTHEEWSEEIVARHEQVMRELGAAAS